MKIKKEIITILKNGGVGVLPTDTLYGLVGSALNKRTVKRIFALKKRSVKKPFIILIGKIADLESFDIVLDESAKKILLKFWPGPVSVILKSKNKNNRLSYLHPLNNTFAFRLPKPEWLKNLLLQTGPLVAPSANLEECPPAQSIKEAKKHFADKADFYVSAGLLKGLPSTLIAVEGRSVIIKRQGRIKIKK